MSELSDTPESQEQQPIELQTSLTDLRPSERLRQDQRELQLTYKDIKSPYPKTMLGLLETGAIYVNEGEVKVDFNKAVTLLEEIKLKQDKAQTVLESYPLPTAQEIQSTYRSLLIGFRDTGLLTNQQISTIGILVRPSSTLPDHSEYASFLYLDHQFPTDNKSRATIGLSQKQFDRVCTHIKELLAKEQIELDAAALGRVATKFTVGHEYGHAADKAVQLKQLDQFMNENPHKQRYLASSEVAHQVVMSVYDTIAPRDQLHALIESTKPKYNFDVDDPARTTSERIATGFERISLGIALSEEGISPTSISLVLEKLDQKDKQQLQEEMLFLESLKQQGITVREFFGAISDIRKHLQGQGLNQITSQLLRGPQGYAALGYRFPLSKTELVEYLSLMDTDS